MEPNNIEENKEKVVFKNPTPEEQINPSNKGQSSQKPIIGAILVAGLLIAGAILLSGSNKSAKQGDLVTGNGIPITTATLTPVGPKDRVLGNSNAKVTLVMYEDFQCPWCGKFTKESEQAIRDKYVKNGSVELVYRDFAFLGQFTKPYVAASDESINAAQAARCAEDQGKFWEYHDYLFTHQNQTGENLGTFSVPNLKSYAKTLGLNTTTFNQCLDANKYAQAVVDAKTEGEGAGVTGTPKGFILVNGKIVDTIDGYLPIDAVTAKIDAALK